MADAWVTCERSMCSAEHWPSASRGNIIHQLWRFCSTEIFKGLLYNAPKKQKNPFHGSNKEQAIEYLGFHRGPLKRIPATCMSPRRVWQWNKQGNGLAARAWLRAACEQSAEPGDNPRTPWYIDGDKWHRSKQGMLGQADPKTPTQACLRIQNYISTTGHKPFPPYQQTLSHCTFP